MSKTLWLSVFLISSKIMNLLHCVLCTRKFAISQTALYVIILDSLSYSIHHPWQLFWKKTSLQLSISFYILYSFIDGRSSSEINKILFIYIFLVIKKHSTTFIVLYPQILSTPWKQMAKKNPGVFQWICLWFCFYTKTNLRWRSISWYEMTF